MASYVSIEKLLTFLRYTNLGLQLGVILWKGIGSKKRLAFSIGIHLIEIQSHLGFVLVNSGPNLITVFSLKVNRFSLRLCSIPSKRYESLQHPKKFILRSFAIKTLNSIWALAMQRYVYIYAHIKHIQSFFLQNKITTIFIVHLFLWSFGGVGYDTICANDGSVN